jgi:hypothetical protein
VAGLFFALVPGDAAEQEGGQSAQKAWWVGKGLSALLGGAGWRFI